MPIGSEGTSLSLKSGRAVLLAVIYRPEAPDPTFAQDFPRSVAVVINSRLDNGLVVRLAHLDAGIIGGASVEVSPAAKSGRIGWFHLPTLEDGFLRQMQLDLDPVTLEHRLVSNGEEQKIQVVSPARDRKRLTDGEYIAYFTPLADPSLRVPRRIPLYRYRLDHSTVSDFEQFPISLAWTDPPTGE